MQGDELRYMEHKKDTIPMVLECMEGAPSTKQQREPHWHVWTEVHMLSTLLTWNNVPGAWYCTQEGEVGTEKIEI